MKSKIIEGFSKLNKEQKINWLNQQYGGGSGDLKNILEQYWNHNDDLQKLHDEFTENTISNFYLPYGIAPNFLINDEIYALPMAIEESSVVAAASKSAKFWLDKGGFKTKLLGNTKLGHIHFIYKGEGSKLLQWFNTHLKEELIKQSKDLTKNMQMRGGGIVNIELIDKSNELENYYQIKGSFNTQDSMGANFINSCLEQFSTTFKTEFQKSNIFNEEEKNSLQIIMSILSNYTPDCMARAEVSCKIKDLKDDSGMPSEEFAWKFKQAVEIAEVEPYRAATHNKGIMNGVDSVVIATGNDFRAVEACAHTYASHTGKYTGLTHCEIKNDQFRFWLDLPISLGIVGGLTKLHPLVIASLQILNNPSAEKLMQIVAVAGLAQNFAAIRSLITTGIQKGHMKMHLTNIINQLGATEEEKKEILNIFKEKTISHHLVAAELERIRKEQ
ncbi:hydroxymethylglutaryl-CoA reductase, degradative [Apibacter sp. wkB309]|uniref:hydroxymethylglutaryl-CoA reductase, degradative n=1 Tax=Apibacter sp. wkB309 TaxID=1679467 RepID=UPI000CF9DDCF|nr:hydroxymethylglutaryl-CoA reductase, degradative [Apibacter sp. wkB309]PQL93020.1 hydroxymethylglutaryl-CoA reductase, degradative [Apibacter sp. wkB309]